ncbi:MAG: N-6 DNA methylase [Candidatus Methanoperedens sp.]
MENSTLVELLKTFNSVPMDIEGDAFGKIYEYFLGKFAMSEGQKGGEFFTPTSIVKLIVEIIEPYHGRIYDPACGSGGMLVQSARFVKNHKKNPGAEISVYGEEKTTETVHLCKMNLAVHGLSGDIREGNTYYEDIHKSVGRFSFVMANPPFNVDRVDKERIKDDPRFPFGIPKPDNANYLWIQVFYSALNESGRAGFIMANSASDARGSEQDIRKGLIEAGAVDVMVAVGSNFFYTVTLPCTLWFLDKGKKNTDRSYKILFIDARHIYRQIDRAHRDFLPDQLELLANIVRLYRGEELETTNGSTEMLKEKFPDGEYTDIPGMCRVATLSEIEADQFYELVKKKSRSKISRSTAEEIYAHAGNTLTVPELEAVISIEIKSGKISKRGSPLLRQALFLAANTAIQNDENLKRFYSKKRSEGKHHFSALNAVAAKLLRIVYWVLKNNKEYQIQLN